MIPSSARQALDALVVQSLTACCGAGRIVPVPLASLSAVAGADPVSLHVSSYQFRLTTLLCLDDTPAMRHALAGLLRSPVPLEDAAFADGRGELANLLCGTINRGLSRVFLHVGMSTPLVLSRSCLAHLELLGAGHSGCLEIALDAQAHFHFAYGLALTRDGQFDFSLTAPVPVQETEVGALELF